MQKIDNLKIGDHNDLSSNLTVLRDNGSKIISVVPISGAVITDGLNRPVKINFLEYVIVHDDGK